MFRLWNKMTWAQFHWDSTKALHLHMNTRRDYRQVSNIRRTFVGNKIVDHSDVVGASPVGAAPTTSSFSTKHLALLDWAKTTARLGKEQLSLVIWCVLYKRFYGIYIKSDKLSCISVKTQYYDQPTCFAQAEVNLNNLSNYRVKCHHFRSQAEYRIYAVECRYNAVEYNTIMHTSLQWSRQNINQGLHSQETPHSSPSRASYDASIVSFWSKLAAF